MSSLISHEQHEQREQIEKQLKIQLHFLKEEILENNYGLINTNQSFIFKKLHSYINDDSSKKLILGSMIEQQVDRTLNSNSLSNIMVYKKLFQALAYSDLVDVRSLHLLDEKINEYIFNKDEDSFQFYNSKTYQIIINNKHLLKNRNNHQKIFNGSNKNEIRTNEIQQSSQITDDLQLINSNDIKINEDQSLTYLPQQLQVIEGKTQQIFDLPIQNNSQQKEINNDDKTINSQVSDSYLDKEQILSDHQNYITNDNQQEIQKMKRIQEIKLEELFTYIFPTQNDMCNQLTELEHLVYLMSKTVNKVYKQKLKCTVYGSYMMGFQLSKSSDIDVSLSLEGNDTISKDVTSKRNFLSILSLQFENNNECELFSFIQAQVPGFQIRKRSIFNPNLLVKVDFTVDNIVGVVKSSLLKVYSSLSPKVQQLVCLFKYFIQAKNIDKYLLNSVSQTYMVIYFLLKCNYVPNVQSYFTDEEQQNHLIHDQIDEVKIRSIIEEQNLLIKINQTPLLSLFTELIEYYSILLNNRQKNKPLIISLLDHPTELIQSQQYSNYPFIIKEFYDENFSVQPNPQFDFNFFQSILNTTHYYLKIHIQKQSLSQFINQIFSYETDENINEKYKQELINEFNLEIDTDDDNFN